MIRTHLNLDYELKKAGFRGDRLLFETIICRTFSLRYPNRTDEDVIADTPEADKYVRACWRELGVEIPHRVINLTLIRLRKSGRLKRDTIVVRRILTPEEMATRTPIDRNGKKELF